MIGPSDAKVQLTLGQAVACPLGPNFALDSEATLVFVLTPPPHKANSKANYGPCVLRCGTATDPSCVFSLRISEDGRYLLIGSGETSITSLGRYAGARSEVYVFFANGSAWMSRDGRRTEAKVMLQLGTVDGGLPAQLTLGGADADGTFPFEGTIGNVMLFDKNISDELGALNHPSPLLRSWVDDRPAEFIAAFNHPAQQEIASALYGVALPGQSDFEVIPRGLLWPPAIPVRWMLAGGDQPPEGVIVLSTDDQSRQGIYTTNHVYCFVRFGKFAQLWSDSGHSFRIAYAGRNQLTGLLLEDGKTQIALELKPGKMGGKDSIEIAPVGGWSNTQKRIFVTTPYPEGTELKGLALPSDNDTARYEAEELIWPAKPTLVRLSDNYNDENNDAGQPAQSWADAFSAKPNLSVYSMCGWDITRIDNPFNPIQTGPADRDEGFFLFEPPKGLEYRSNGNLPYYIFRHNLAFGYGSKDTLLYRSMREFSAEFASTVTAGAGMGSVDFADASFTSEVNHGQAVHTEHSVAIDYKLDLLFAGLLEKQWMTLNPRFIMALLDAIGSDYQTQPAPGATAKPPAILSAPAGSDPHAKLRSLFKIWGTHYPNAVTYGTSTFSVGLIDDASLTEMGGSQQDWSVSLDVPVGSLMAKLGTKQKSGQTHKVETGSHSEIYSSITAGAPDREVPLLLDLRPVWELMQPPYVASPRVACAVPFANDILLAMPHIKAAWSEYIDLFKKPVPDGSIFYDVRFVSLHNGGGDRLFITARADIGGVQQDTGWKTSLPHERIGLWPESTKRLETGQVATVDGSPVVRLSMQASRMAAAVPALFLTGVISEIDLNLVKQHLTTWEEQPPLFGIEVPPRVTVPTAAELDAEIDRIARFNEPALDDFGPAPALGPTEGFDRRLDMIRPMPELPPDGTPELVSMSDGNITLTFEVRMLDVRACWEKLHAKGRAGTG